MPEPSSAPDSPRTAAAAGPSEGGIPADATPYLLVMPTTDGAPPGLVWPGQEGQPAWAIPVTVPAGTRGYAVFLPLVPAPAGEGPAAPVPVAQQATAGAPARVIPAQVVTPGATEVAAPVPVGPEASAPAGVAEAEHPTPGAPAAGADGSAEQTGTNGRETATAEVSSPATGASAQPTAVSAAAGSGDADSSAPAPTSPGSTQPATPSGPAPTVPQQRPVPGGAAPQPHVAPGAPMPPYAAQPAPPWATFPPQPGATWTPRPPTPRTSFLGARWPGPKQATGRATPLAVLAGALGIAFFVPLSRTGIGWFLGWLVLTAGVAAVRRGTAELPRTERLIRGGWAVAALALLSVLAFRNAWWLVTFCVLGALACATLAIVGGRLVRSILFSLVAAPFAALRGLPWVRRHITASPDTGMVRRVAGSVVATVVVLLVFGTLLSSADAAFSEVLGAIVPEINIGTVFRWIFLAGLGALIAVAAVYTLAAPPDLSTVDKPSSRNLGLLEWGPAIGALTLLFAGFVVVQFTVLFGGQRHVQKVAGLSYSEYARSGFWQLLFVTLLTLAVLGAVSRWASRERKVERTALRVLLGLLSALSVVIVVSALSRMYTYQKVYSFTGERIFVMAFELLLGAVFLMVLAAGVRWRGRWIPGATVGLAVVMLLSLAVLNPEDYAAQRNIARYKQSGKIDAWYLRALSADATPALTKLPDPVRRCTLSWIDDDLAEPDPWYAWNLGRYRARQALDRIGKDAVGGPKDCRAADQFDLPKSRRPR
ncbi:uncharacterized protein DUF4173 [Micromonospora kangleipakensis]|uniref:Uncharacterized protein DUF4173 n=1 Tax=Micromonospora kangleipakensis TaxID=1077942 RepID=A0A4Q8B764_9ACTN|nr:DUF4153 domain-containing protein [Micromonospora kangleipakensis]RZU73502.1 uncharacterized protein DUF4173 [Micromonospora kangleipakensis]